MIDKEEPEEELRIYKDRLEGAMEAGNLAWWEMELPSGKIEFNDRKAKMLGYSPKQFNYYSDFTDLIHPEDYDRAMKAMREHLEGKKDRYETEYRIKKKDGDYKWFRDIGGITKEEEEYKKVTGVVIDIDQRKKAQKEKEKSHRQLKRMLHNQPGMAYRCLNDKNWTMKFISDGCEELTGYKPEELINNKEISYNEIIIPEDREKVWDEIQKSLEKEESYQLTYQIKTKDDEKKWVWEQGQGVFEDGEVKFLEGIIQDITKRVKRKRELKKAKEEWRKTFDSIPDIAAVISKDHEILEVNEEGASLLGKKPSELVGKKCYEVVHNQDTPIDECPCEKVLETGKADVGEVFKEHGRHYIASASPIHNEEGEVESFVHTVKDITKQKKIQEELQEKNERLETIFETTEDAILVSDVEGNVILANQAAAEMAGFEDKEEYLNHNVFEFVHPDDKEDVLKAVEETFKEGEVQERKEFRVVTTDGETIHVRSGTGILRNDEGKPIATVNILRDITDQKEKEEKLRRSEERKDFLNTLLRQDLGGKYQTIQGYLRLLEEEVDLPEEQREYLEKAIKAGRKVDEILGLAKKLNEIEGTELEGKKDIVKVLNQVTNDIKGFVEREGVEIEKNYSEKIGQVEGDYSLSLIFSQILLTRIQISNCNKIRIRAKEKEKNILVRIMDDGDPLPSDIKKMFSGGVYTGETTGVGGVRYYMIKQIANHNNAEIEVKDSEMGGARFDIYLQKA